MTPSTPADTAPGVSEIVHFWLGDELQDGWPIDPAVAKRWWRGGPRLDAAINERFGAQVRRALAGELACWEPKPLARLALVILLDQFTRNVFRGQADAFAGDTRAQALAVDALERGLDAELPLAGRLFMGMPLMHAEDLALQERSVQHIAGLAESAPEALRETLADNLRFAKAHRDIVARFGRFPYRNAVLGRTDTPEETDFLRDGPRFGQ